MAEVGTIDCAASRPPALAEGGLVARKSRSPESPTIQDDIQLPRTGDIVIAIRVLGLLPDLPKSTSRVGIAIIGHFNAKTGQCNPGFERLAQTLRIERSSVIAAINLLDRTALIFKRRRANRTNSYQPNWSRFRELDESWKAVLRGGVPAEVGFCCRVGLDSTRFGGRKNSTQTYLKNLSKELHHESDPNSVGDHDGPAVDGRELAKQRRTTPAAVSPDHPAYIAAQRHWNRAMLSMCGKDAERLSAIASQIDAEQADAITRAELRRRGGGLSAIGMLAPSTAQKIASACPVEHPEGSR